MTALAFLVLLNLFVSVVACVSVLHHHWYSVSSPTSAANRILVTMSDLKGRLDIVERVILKGGN